MKGQWETMEEKLEGQTKEMRSDKMRNMDLRGVPKRDSCLMELVVRKIVPPLSLLAEDE